jgi:hypothetical protein
MQNIHQHSPKDRQTDGWCGCAACCAVVQNSFAYVLNQIHIKRSCAVTHQPTCSSFLMNQGLSMAGYSHSYSTQRLRPPDIMWRSIDSLRAPGGSYTTGPCTRHTAAHSTHNDCQLSVVSNVARNGIECPTCDLHSPM